MSSPTSLPGRPLGDPVAAPPPIPGAFVLQMETGLSASLSQPGAAWAALAAGLSLGVLTGADVAGHGLSGWQILLLCILLVDGLWGGIWRGLTGLAANRSPGQNSGAAQLWLPYLQPGSPAARLLGRGTPGEIDQNLRATLPMLLATLFLASVLGTSALVLTGVFVLVAGFAWVGEHSRQIPVGLLHSVATILLPWGLVLLVLGQGEISRSWLLAVLWSLHSWGVLRLAAHPTGERDPVAMGLMAMTNLAVAGLLILAQVPLWVAILAALWLPAWLSLLQGGHPRRVNLLWTLSMLVSAGALATTL